MKIGKLSPAPKKKKNVKNIGTTTKYSTVNTKEKKYETILKRVTVKTFIKQMKNTKSIRRDVTE